MSVAVSSVWRSTWRDMQVSSILWRLPGWAGYSEFCLWCTGPEMTQCHVLRDTLKKRLQTAINEPVEEAPGTELK